jgi:hypothetical protein
MTRSSVTRGSGILWLLICSCCCQCVAHAQTQRPVPFRNRAVDLVILKEDVRLYGIVLPSSAKDPEILVRRSWLTSEKSEFFRERIEPLLAATKQAESNPLAAAVTMEIERLRKETPDDVQRIGLLGETRDRIQTRSAADSPWLVIVLPQDQVQRVQTQSPRLREFGYWGILNQVDGVESQSWQEVSRSLSQIPLPQRVTELPADNSTHGVHQSLKRILAAVDIATARIGKMLQVGSSVLPDDDRLSVEAIMPTLLNGSLQQQLGELLSGQSGTQDTLLKLPALDQLPADVIRMAEAKDWQTVRVSAFGISLKSSAATARTVCFTRHGDGQWEQVFRVQTQVAASEVSEAQVDQIQQDPRIQQISALFAGLGSSSGDVSRALQLGGCLRLALSQCEDQLQTQVSNVLQGRNAQQSTPPPTRVRLVEMP